MASLKWIPIAIMGVVFPIFIVMIPPHQMALGDPKHCNGYGYYTIGYNVGHNDAQNGWIIVFRGYNDGFRAGNRSSTME